MDYINRVIAYIKLHWVTVLALLLAVWAYAEPTVVAYVSAHPALSFWYGLIAVVVGFYIKSPTGGVLMMLRLKKKVGE